MSKIMKNFQAKTAQQLMKAIERYKAEGLQNEGVFSVGFCKYDYDTDTFLEVKVSFKDVRHDDMVTFSKKKKTVDKFWDLNQVMINQIAGDFAPFVIQ